MSTTDGADSDTEGAAVIDVGVSSVAAAIRKLEERSKAFSPDIYKHASSVTAPVAVPDAPPVPEGGLDALFAPRARFPTRFDGFPFATRGSPPPARRGSPRIRRASPTKYTMAKSDPYKFALAFDTPAPAPAVVPDSMDSVLSEWSTTVETFSIDAGMLEIIRLTQRNKLEEVEALMIGEKPEYKTIRRMIDGFLWSRDDLDCTSQVQASMIGHTLKLLLKSSEIRTIFFTRQKGKIVGRLFETLAFESIGSIVLIDVLNLLTHCLTVYPEDTRRAIAMSDPSVIQHLASILQVGKDALTLPCLRFLEAITCSLDSSNASTLIAKDIEKTGIVPAVAQCLETEDPHVGSAVATVLTSLYLRHPDIILKGIEKIRETTREDVCETLRKILEICPVCTR